MDETYIKVKGQWMYFYRAVDKAGNTVDFLLNRQWLLDGKIIHIQNDIAVVGDHALAVHRVSA